MSDDVSQRSNKATKQDWIALSVLSLPVLLVAIDSTVLNFALPHITEDLNPRPDEMLWIIDIYSFILAGLLVTMGTLGDKIGRRKLLIYGSVGFGLASLGAALSTNALMLIFSRALLGVAGATLMPSTLSIIRNTFHNTKERRTAMGTWAAIFSGGAAIGPVIGGLLLSKFSWHSIFLVNIPIMILLVILGPMFIQESKSETAGDIDFLSVFLCLAAILPMVYGIKMSAEELSLFPLLIFIFGAIMAYCFVVRQKHVSYPLLDLKLFESPLFTWGTILNLVSIFALIGGDFILIQYLQLGLGVGTLEASLLIAPAMFAEALAALVAVKLANIYPLHIILFIGFMLTTSGFVIASFLGLQTPLWVVFVIALLLCWGTGTSYTLANDAILSEAPADRAGSAAAVSETSYELGAALGIAILGTIANFIYRTTIVLPAGLSSEQQEQAKTTLATTIQSAHGNTALIDAAQVAFTRGAVVVSMVAAVLMILSGLAALRIFKGVKLDTENSLH
ncbi:MAG: MFS transporter [Micrococcaceae bacterium]